MTTQTEALKLALEALETSARNWPSDSIIEAITAIKEVLAQPEQERCVGCEACIDTACGRDECPKGWPKAAQPEQEPFTYYDPVRDSIRPFRCDGDIPLYTTPPQRTWVWLTDREKSNLWLESRAAIPRFHTYASLVEAKLKEKNT